MAEIRILDEMVSEQRLKERERERERELAVPLHF